MRNASKFRTIFLFVFIAVYILSFFLVSVKYFGSNVLTCRSIKNEFSFVSYILSAYVVDIVEGWKLNQDEIVYWQELRISPSAKLDESG